MPLNLKILNKASGSVSSALQIVLIKNLEAVVYLELLHLRNVNLEVGHRTRAFIIQ